MTNGGMSVDARVNQALSLRRRIVVVLLLAFCLLPLASALALFALHEPSRALGIDALLSVGIGSSAPGMARLAKCEDYVERGRYTYTGSYCSITIQSAGERVTRIVDVSDPVTSDRILKPGRVLGALGVAMPLGIMVNRLRVLAVLLTLSVLGPILFVLLARSEYRHRRRRKTSRSTVKAALEAAPTHGLKNMADGPAWKPPLTSLREDC